MNTTQNSADHEGEARESEEGVVKDSVKVSVLNAAGGPLFHRLWDDGGVVLRFDSGNGFVDRLDCERFGWRVVGGWMR